MKKNILYVLLVLMVFSIVLSACNPAPAPEPTAQPTEAGAAAQPTAIPTDEPVVPTEVPTMEPPVDIELWAGGSMSEAAPPPEDWAVYNIVKEQLNINLSLVLLPTTMTDQDTKINAAAASNSLPDIFMVNRDNWYKLVQAGLVANVDELLTMMPTRTAGHYNDEIRNKLVMVDGSMYGLPDPGAMPMTDGMVIRKDWLEKLGLEVPTTLEEFKEVAIAFSNDDPDGNGAKDTYGLCAFIDGTGLNQAGVGPRFDFVFGAFGVAGTWNVSSSESFGLNVRDPRTMQAVQYIKELQDAKVIDPDWPTLKKDEFRAHWKQGTCGIMVENFAALANKSNYKDFDANFPEGEWIAIAPPTGPDGDSSQGVTVKTARIYAVSQKAIDEGKGPAIARFLEWTASEEGYFLLAFGQEGVNYNLDADGYVTTEGIAEADAWNGAEAAPLSQLRNMVYINTDIELKARYKSHVSANGKTIDPLAYWEAFGTYPFTESTGSSIINPPANAADFVRFYSENIVNFILGQQPLDEASWQAFVDGLDSLGAKDLEATAKESLLSAGFIK
ncbi:MAG: ABC transporter substrate-binding protein [Chloroflexi bacterium HGW-Chloroflexi-10]|nr:MAG: ABC transporter substrate-binding protein [Chloroflexi bacterium HGW-Chloroflexi-10]